MLSTHETSPTPELSGIFLLISPALQYNKKILEDFVSSNCWQIVTGTYPRFLHEIACKVVTSLEGLEGSGLQSAIVEWGGANANKDRLGLLVGPIPEDFEKYNWIQKWEVPNAWLHVHFKYL
jgi:hypothetical protein